MQNLPSTCLSCNSKVPLTIKLDIGVKVSIKNHTVTDPCPKCGGTLSVKDGVYTANNYKVEYSSKEKKSSDKLDNKTKSLKYGNYIEKLSREFDAELNKIETEHNFEFGEEFEKAICKILRRVLPGEFGVCRGYVVDAVGNSEGDDIIIYDKMRFPRLRPVDESDTETKQRIPIEAVYAYIEAKHTLTLTGDDGQSFAKAIEQVGNVKALCNTRPVVSWNALNRHVTVNKNISVTREADGPESRNPVFTAIFARNVRMKKGQSHINPTDVISKLQENNQNIPAPFKNAPDFAVLGSHASMLPFLRIDGDNIEYVSPFQVEGTQCMPVSCNGTAFGIALCSILFALDNIQLGKMNWSEIIFECINT